jgi:hypothetical protein
MPLMMMIDVPIKKFSSIKNHIFFPRFTCSSLSDFVGVFIFTVDGSLFV